MNTEQEIKSIVNQLRALQIQQSTLIQRMEQLTGASTNLDGPPSAAPRRAAAPLPVTQPRYHTPRVTTTSGYERDEFPAGLAPYVLGQRVRIRNPSGNQRDEGIITKITRKRITVRTTDNTYISRAPHNIRVWEISQIQPPTTG